MKLSKGRSGTFKSRMRNDLLPQIKGLSEKEINRFYSLAAIKKLKSADILIKEGDLDQTAYIILDGEIKILKDISGQATQLNVLRKGDWVGEIALARQIPRTASAVAAEPTIVMALDQKTLDALDAKTQLHFLKQLNALASCRIDQLEKKEEQLTHRNDQLITDIYYERTQRMAEFHDSEMIQGILKKIPKLPAFANSLISNIMSDDISAAEVAEETKREPALAGIVLKTINSSYYGFQKKISDIHHAIMLLGFNELYQLIVSEGIRRTMPDTPLFQELHFHCVAVSNIAFTLSQKICIAKPAQIATIGLLHDLGNIVLLLLKKQNPKLKSLIDVLDRARIGGLLLKSWGLPDDVCQSVEYQFYPEFSPPHNIPQQARDNIAILYIAHLCYQNYQDGTAGKMHTTFLPEYKQQLQLDKYSLSDISHELVLPGLVKNINSLPAQLRSLVKKQVDID